MSRRIIPLTSRGVLQVTGREAKPFLQKLITQDIEKLSPTQALYGALLTPEGRYFSDFFILEKEGCVYLEVPKAHIIALANQFNTYRMRMEVSFHDLTEAMYSFVILGPGGEAHDFELVPFEGACRADKSGFVFVDPRLQALGVRLLTTPQTTLPLQQIPRGTEADYHFFRTKMGISEAPDDLISGQSIILEHGFYELSGISWEKGCYPGQELMARTFYRGQLHKRAFPLTIEGPPPAAQTQLYDKEQRVGEMLGNCTSMGMSLLQIEVAQACEATKSFLVSGSAKLYPYTLSWMSLGMGPIMIEA